MNRDIFFAIFIAVGLVLFSIYWFFGLNPFTYLLSGNEITVVVKDGAYNPNVIEVNAGTPAKLKFIRQDQAPCAGTLVFPRLNMSFHLPLNQPIIVNLPPLQAGQYIFNCGTSMYSGKIIAN